MGYKAEGKIEKIFETQQKSASFTAREFVIEVEDGQYPQMVKFQLVQDKCSLIDDYNEGDKVEVEFDLRGREWNEKYFTNLQAWRISKAGEGSSDGGSSGGAAKSTPPKEADNVGSTASADFDDDIPFRSWAEPLRAITLMTLKNCKLDSALSLAWTMAFRRAQPG